MRKLIILLLCCGLIIGMVGCGGNTAPPTESPPTIAAETIITETPVETTPPITAVEPTEKERKRASPDRERGSGNRANHARHRAYNNGRANRRTKDGCNKHHRRKSFFSNCGNGANHTAAYGKRNDGN